MAGGASDSGPSHGPAAPVLRVCTYFIDESGEGVLFDANGRVRIYVDNCSQNFYLGLADVAEPEQLTTALGELRTRLLADPYLRGVPSMQPAARKTARLFHAKDDVPEVRQEVFRLILEHDVRFIAEVKSMTQVLAYVRARNESDPEYRYHPNELYDHLVRRLLKTKLHKEDRYVVTFARRGGSDRAEALKSAIRAAQTRFYAEHGLETMAEITVRSGQPEAHGGLQVVDYFLWALQRLYERREERYLSFLSPKISLVHDIDDTRQNEYGVYYDRRRPLTTAAIEKRLRI